MYIYHSEVKSILLKKYNITREEKGIDIFFFFLDLKKKKKIIKL